MKVILTKSYNPPHEEREEWYGKVYTCPNCTHTKIWYSFNFCPMCGWKIIWKEALLCATE